MKKRHNLTPLMVMFLAVCLLASNAVAEAWAPSKPVEFVVQASPGGGSDIMARTIAGVIEAQKLAPVPFVVVNKPGGGSVVGTSYVAGQKGNPHILMTYHSGNLVAPISAGVETATAKHLSVMGIVAIDEQLLVVKADSSYKSISDVVNKAKENPGTITVGGTYTGQDDQICNRLFERAAGIKLRYVPFNSGGEVMTAILGGHIDLIWANPSEIAPQLEAKQVRAIGVAKEDRLPFMADVPTFQEAGYNFTWKMFRSVVAPAELPKEAESFYESLFKKMTDSPQWKDGYLKKYMLSPAWMGNVEGTKFIGEIEQTCMTVLKELELVK